jgi:hypothetical protein
MQELIIGTLLAVAVLSGQTASQKKPAPSRTWTQEPTDFKGVPFDATLEQAKQRQHFDRCIHGDESDPDTEACFLNVHVNDTYDILCDFSFKRGRLEDIAGRFPSERYEDVRELLIEKYGDPTFHKTSEVRTVAGGQLEQEELTWIGRKVILTAYRFRSNIDKGGLSFRSVAGILERDAEREKQNKKALQ